jgi:hypothetical protein
MKCNNIKGLIHLNKFGELSNTEKVNFEQHINTCDACTELVKSIENADKYIQNLQKIEPELTYPQVLTSNIMQSINNSETSKQYSLISNGFFEILFSNKVKILAYTIIIGLIGLFSYQQLFIINKLNQMEKSIAVKVDENIDLLKTPYNVNTRLLKDFATGIEDEQVVLDKKSVEQFIELYKDLKTDHNDLLEFLNSNIKNLERKLSKKDLKKLKQLLKEDDLVKNLSTNL